MRTRIAATVAALAAATGTGTDHGASVTSDTHVLAGRSNTAR